MFTETTCFYTAEGTFGQCKRLAYSQGLELRRNPHSKFVRFELYDVNDTYQGSIEPDLKGKSSSTLEQTGQYGIFICKDFIQ